MNDTATFNTEMNDPNVSMGDNAFEYANINEKKYKCPICEANIVESSVSSHLKGFHNPNFYEQILLKIKEKDNLIKKTLQDLSNLKYLFENNALHGNIKPKKNVVKEFINIVKKYQ